jgi:fatty acid desaturase
VLPPLPHVLPACRNRKLNDWVGRVAITLYAYFDYGMLHKKHWDHHGYTGQPGKDPDFHRGNTNVLAWFGRCAAIGYQGPVTSGVCMQLSSTVGMLRWLA